MLLLFPSCINTISEVTNMFWAEIFTKRLIWPGLPCYRIGNSKKPQNLNGISSRGFAAFLVSEELGA